jgi:hypothetical protein
MRTLLTLLTLAGVLCASLFASHAADKKHLGGPKGGRLLEKTEPKAEFYLEKDHTVTITFYDASLKPVPAGAQVVTTDAKGGKATIEFEKKGQCPCEQTSCPRATDIISLSPKPSPMRNRKTRFKLEHNLRWVQARGVCLRAMSDSKGT